MVSESLSIINPVNGAIFHETQGNLEKDSLYIDISGKILTDNPVYVNGVEAFKENNSFLAKVPLTIGENEIIIKYGAEREVIKVIRDGDTRLRYAFAIDDNVFFLRDIANNNYDSLFDNFYLKGLKNLNEKYGAKFTLNIFFELNKRYYEELKLFGPFSLDKFPDKYKDEWEENSNWLKLAMHSFSEFPHRPYQKVIGARVEKLSEDFDLFEKEIKRFSGEAYCPPSIFHWAMVPQESWEMLVEKGVKTLCGYHILREGDGNYEINHGLDNERSEFLSKNKALKDFESGIVFCDLDLLFNATNIEAISDRLHSVIQDPKKKGVITLSTHEQYFWREYYAPGKWFLDGNLDNDKTGHQHLPEKFTHIEDHFQRLDLGLKIVTENGYEPVFLHECLNL